MFDRDSLTRRDGLKVLAGAAAVGGAGAVTLAGAQQSENGDRTLEWGGQGSENAQLSCGSAGTGYWHWILTPGGQPALEADAELTVTFDDDQTATVTGYRPGGGGGAVHFEVERAGGGEIVDAEVSFTGGGNNVVLTISDSHCEGDEPPTSEPLVVALECVKRRGQIAVTNPNDDAVTVTVTGPDDYESSRPVAAGETVLFENLLDGSYDLATDPSSVGLDQETVAIQCIAPEPTDLEVSHRCDERGGRITVTNPNGDPVPVDLSGPDDFERSMDLNPGETVYLAKLPSGHYELSAEPDGIGLEREEIDLSCS